MSPIGVRIHNRFFAETFISNGTRIIIPGSTLSSIHISLVGSITSPEYLYITSPEGEPIQIRLKLSAAIAFELFDKIPPLSLMEKCRDKLPLNTLSG